jgi:hypothetical protein
MSVRKGSERVHMKRNGKERNERKGMEGTGRNGKEWNERKGMERNGMNGKE